MSRGHEALQLVADFALWAQKLSRVELASLELAQPAASLLLREAQRIALAAKADCVAPSSAAFDRDYCIACEAIHPPIGLPEPHGARRGC